MSHNKLSTSRFPAVFNLTDLNGANGFVLKCDIVGDYSGFSVSGAGDVSGDGLADVIIGAHQATTAGAGQSYVVFGARAWPNVFHFTDLNGTNGFTINGINQGDQIGFSVSGAGDVSGDGLADVIIGAPQVNTFAGQSYVVLGAHAWPAVMSLSSLNGRNGFTLNGVSSRNWSGVVSGAGDVNGDGLSDVIIGAHGVNNDAGQSYVVFGARAWPAIINLKDLNGAIGFAINGINQGDESGWERSVSGVGDVNGDGLSDVIISAHWANNHAGQSYVVFGAHDWPDHIDVKDLNGATGFAINGINQGDESGGSVSGAGDVNGDGLADVVIGAPHANNGAGQSYVVFGAHTWPAEIDLGDLNGATGFAINGINQGDESGSSVSGAGDVNGDGIADVVIGAPHANNGAGQSYVVFGAHTWPAEIDLGDLNGATGFAINGINQGDESGGSVSGAGDVNGDGLADVVIGAYGVNNYAGQSYVIFGQNSSSTDHEV